MRRTVRRSLPAAALLLFILAGCTARFQSFPFVTAEGDRIEIRQSPGRPRDTEAVFEPTQTRSTSPRYSLGKSVEIRASRQAFALAYTSALSDCRLEIFSDRKTLLKSVRLPPSTGTAIRFLVPLAAGDTVWGYRLKEESPAGPGEALHLLGAGISPFVRGFVVTPEGLSVDGSVEVRDLGPGGLTARITDGALQYMAHGIWQIRIGIAPAPDSQAGGNTIRFSSGDDRTAVFSVDRAAGLGSLSFARGSTGFLPVDVSARLPVTSLDISLLPADRPIPADPGMILQWERDAWRRPDFEVFSWERFPDVLIFDTASYDVQDSMFKRLAYFVEKAGYRGSIETPEALAGRHGYNAHDYRSEDLARFFTEAEGRGLPLTAGESILLKILEESDLIRRTAGGFQPGEGAVISISRSSGPELRRLLLSHESAHGEFFSLPAYREGVEAVWESLSPVEKAVWEDFLSGKAYDTTDHYLVVNEFQAYLFQQDREGVEGFQSLTLSRMKERGGAAAALARRLLAERPHSFLDSFDALDAKLRAAGGPPGGLALAVMREK